MTAAHSMRDTPPRVLGRITGAEPGPTLIVIGGIHGNEPAGVHAVTNVVTHLLSTHEIVRGELLGLTGNPPALAAGVRYLDRDLNRRWGPIITERGASAEDQVQTDLLTELHAAFDRARGEVYVMDLHTMSGPGRPFAVFADTLRSRRFAQRFWAPLLLGFDEYLNGALVDYLAGLGHAAISIEGGRHEDPDSVATLEAAVWVGIATCDLTAARNDKSARARALLRAASRGLPPALEIIHRHAIAEQDGFVMAANHSSFDRVESGTVLGRDTRGEVTTPTSGYLMLPLYQTLGDEGFFMARPVNRFWLSLSRWMRQLRLAAVAHWLPGVRRDRSRPGEYLVNKRVARFGAIKVLHLLGFRRVHEDQTTLRVRRRRFDLP